MCSFDYIFFWNISNSAFLLEKWTEKKSIKKRRKENNRDQPISFDQCSVPGLNLNSISMCLWLWLCCIPNRSLQLFIQKMFIYCTWWTFEMKCFKIHKKTKKKTLDMWIYYYAHNLCLLLLLLLLLSILKNSWQD